MRQHPKGVHTVQTSKKVSSEFIPTIINPEKIPTPKESNVYNSKSAYEFTTPKGVAQNKIC